MRPDLIEDHELLYRAIYPDYWVQNEEGGGRISSAAFKTDGVSVDRDGERSEDEAAAFVLVGREDHGVACLLTRECREADTYPIPKPLENNEYHAEIWQSADRSSLSRGRAKKLAACADIVRVPPEHRQE